MDRAGDATGGEEKGERMKGARDRAFRILKNRCFLHSMPCLPASDVVFDWAKSGTWSGMVEFGAKCGITRGSDEMRWNGEDKAEGQSRWKATGWNVNGSASPARWTSWFGQNASVARGARAEFRMFMAQFPMPRGKHRTAAF